VVKSSLGEADRTWERQRAAATGEMLGEKPRNRTGGDVVHAGFGVLSLQPVAEVFDGTDDLVDESDSMPASQEEADEGAKEGTERTGTQTSDVVRPLKE
jgi:hypothetical protein